MSDSLFSDPDGMKRHSEQFTKLGNHLDLVMGNTTMMLNTYGKCWGSDEFGAQFEQNYAPTSNSTVSVGSGLSTVLHTTTTGLKDSSVAYENNADANRQIADANRNGLDSAPTGGGKRPGR